MYKGHERQHSLFSLAN